jgi:hypothetical protein
LWLDTHAFYMRRSIRYQVRALSAQPRLEAKSRIDSSSRGAENPSRQLDDLTCVRQPGAEAEQERESAG